MASAIKKPDGNAMAQDDAPGEAEDERHEKDREARDLTGGGGGKPLEYRSASSPAGSGFFHVYKSGQGYWTRMGTAAGAALVGILSAVFVYSDLRPRIPFLANQDHPSRPLWAALAFLAAFAGFVFWFVNRPRNADFLIATDSEMKKVNWTSRKELIGSTKIVILFMFLIATLLFAIDIFFGYFFWMIGVLKNRPF